MCAVTRLRITRNTEPLPHNILFSLVTYAFEAIHFEGQRCGASKTHTAHVVGSHESSLNGPWCRCVRDCDTFKSRPSYEKSKKPTIDTVVRRGLSMWGGRGRRGVSVFWVDRSTAVCDA